MPLPEWSSSSSSPDLPVLFRINPSSSVTVYVFVAKTSLSISLPSHVGLDLLVRPPDETEEKGNRKSNDETDYDIVSDGAILKVVAFLSGWVVLHVDADTLLATSTDAALGGALGVLCACTANEFHVVGLGVVLSIKLCPVGVDLHFFAVNCNICFVLSVCWLETSTEIKVNELIVLENIKQLS